jgi:hypothetical protein
MHQKPLQLNEEGQCDNSYTYFGRCVGCGFEVRWSAAKGQKVIKPEENHGVWA